MSSPEREFNEALLVLAVPAAVVLILCAWWAIQVSPSPVLSPGDGGVPAVTGTAGTSTTQ